MTEEQRLELEKLVKERRAIMLGLFEDHDIGRFTPRPARTVESQMYEIAVLVQDMRETVDRIEDKIDRIDGHLGRIEGHLDRIESHLDRIIGPFGPVLAWFRRLGKPKAKG